MAMLVNMSLYSRLQQKELSEADLRRFCFPRPHSQPGRAQLFNIDQSFNTVIPGRRSRNCRRCKTVYSIDNLGRVLTKDTCAHHWGKLSRTAYPYYYCCNLPLGSRPCSTAPQHVSEEIDPNNLTGFINTSLNSSVTSEAIYALDCEMVFTTAGMDVAAISIVDSNCQLVYETLVHPDDPIVDYNTEHSGLSRNMFQGVSTLLKDVHAKLLTLVGSRTILVGHGLDHDLMRLKVIHDHVVDTSVLFPHPRGFPTRNSLNFLKERFGGGLRSSSYGLKCRADAEAVMHIVNNMR
ncbi:exonuclease GOR-like [Procambarus clarkii]|uniref:exonuclease GOR-like n=1 Tax=Procambarus clarkii TaxID=6728 RepID=UPI0037424497